jgi:hypothetical protein
MTVEDATRRRPAMPDAPDRRHVVRNIGEGLGVADGNPSERRRLCAPLWKASVDVAREMIEKLIDDLDGSDAAETVSFALDGASFEIDLSKKNAAAFRKSLDRYISAARRQGGSGPTPRRRASKSTSNRAKPKRDFDLAQLRDWAGANGVAVPSRGRIPQAIVEEYKAAGGR